MAKGNKPRPLEEQFSPNDAVTQQPSSADTLLRNNVVSLPQTQDVPQAKHAKKAAPHTSITLPPPVLWKLKELAVVKRCKLNDVFLEAVDDLLKKHSAGSIADLTNDIVRP